MGGGGGGGGALGDLLKLASALSGNNTGPTAPAGGGAGPLGDLLKLTSALSGNNNSQASNTNNSGLGNCKYSFFISYFFHTKNCRNLPTYIGVEMVIRFFPLEEHHFQL